LRSLHALSEASLESIDAIKGENEKSRKKEASRGPTKVKKKTPTKKA